MRTTQGFTLLELMITVAIIGILAAIAIPNYNAYVLRGNRTVAKTILAEVASRQESFFTDRKTYATVLGPGTSPPGLGYPADTFYFGKNGTPSSSATGALYAVTLVATATSFTVTATAQAGSAQAKDTQCASLSLTNTGVKSATGGGGSDCWTR